MIEIFENKAQRKFGCLMVVFDIAEGDWKEIGNKIKFHEDLYNDESGKFGVETEPHVTVLYGLHDDRITLDDVKALIPPIMEMTAILTAINHFECPAYDVLKFEVDAPRFHSANSALREKLPYSTDYPDYVPHMTIAYLNKGTGAKYANDSLNVPLKPKQYKYGFADGRDEFFMK